MPKAAPLVTEYELEVLCVCVEAFFYWLAMDFDTVSQKTDTKLLPITSPNITRFSNFFH